MKNKTRVKKKILKPTKSRVKNFQKIFIILGLCLGLFILVLFLNSKYFSKTNINKTNPEIKSEITPTITQQTTPTKIVDPTGWTTYNSKELGLSFKYPNYWGEPTAFTIDDYNDKKKLPDFLSGSAGKEIFIEFTFKMNSGSTEPNEYEYMNSVSIVGITKDYKFVYYGGTPLTYEDIFNDKKDLGLYETFSQEKGNIYFTQKVTVANQKTTTKTSFDYLSEGSGVSIGSSTKLNGKNEYSGISISAFYDNFNKILNKYYDGVEDKGIEPVVIKLLTGLKNGTSQDKEMTKLYKDYQTLLSSIKFN